MSFRARLAASLAVVSLLAALPARGGDASPSRFFYAGDGVLSLESLHAGKRIRVRFREADGSYSKDALARIDDLFRSGGGGERIRVSLRLLELIDYLEDHERPKALLL